VLAIPYVRSGKRSHPGKPEGSAARRRVPPAGLDLEGIQRRDLDLLVADPAPDTDGAKREAPAKILARYFTQRRRDADARGTIIRRVRNLFVETASEIERGKNPQRSRDWIEQSLETLQRDGIIAAWSYVEDVDLLPRYKWLEPWLDYHVAVTLKP